MIRYVIHVLLSLGQGLCSLKSQRMPLDVPSRTHSVVGWSASRLRSVAGDQIACSLDQEGFDQWPREQENDVRRRLEDLLKNNAVRDSWDKGCEIVLGFFQEKD